LTEYSEEQVGDEHGRGLNILSGGNGVAEGRTWEAQLKLVSGQNLSGAFCLGAAGGGAQRGHGGGSAASCYSPAHGDE